jgi:hypothetical protein
LDALPGSVPWVRLFAIRRCDVWQLIRISLSVHRIWEVLSVRCLGHGGAHVVALASS